MQVIPPTELVKHLNQVDLSVLRLVNKGFYAIFDSFYHEIKQFSSTRAATLDVCFSLIDISIVNIEYSMNYVFPQHTIINSVETYDPYFDISIVVDLIRMKDLSLQIGDMINFRNKDGGCISLFVVEKRFIHAPEKFRYKELDENTYISNCKGMIPYQNFAPYHWSNFSGFQDFFIPSSHVRFHPLGSKETEYVEIIFEKFRFRLDCFHHFISLSNSKYISIRINYHLPSVNRRIKENSDICYIDGIYSY